MSVQVMSQESSPANLLSSNRGHKDLINAFIRTWGVDISASIGFASGHLNAVKIN